MRKCVNLVDLEKCCKMSIYLQRSASIKLRNDRFIFYMPWATKPPSRTYTPCGEGVAVAATHPLFLPPTLTPGRGAGAAATPPAPRAVRWEIKTPVKQLLIASQRNFEKL